MLRPLILSVVFAIILVIMPSNSTTVNSLEAYPLGPSAFWLRWQKPLDSNDELTGYNIYYEHVRGSEIGERRKYEPEITDPNVTSVKLRYLIPYSKYRISISTQTKNGEGPKYFIEKQTSLIDAQKPAVPSFNSEQMLSDNGFVTLRINWLPNTEGHAGSSFFTKYRVKDEPTWTPMMQETKQDYQFVYGLQPDTVYEIRVVSVDEEYATESEIREIHTLQMPETSLLNMLDSRIDAALNRKLENILDSKIESKLKLMLETKLDAMLETRLKSTPKK